jgi:iron complex transport system substrate-binding protein
MSSMEGKKDYSKFIEKWQNWKSIPAVKRNVIYVIDSNLVGRPTPRNIEGLEGMVRVIHPEVLGKKR